MRFLPLFIIFILASALLPSCISDDFDDSPGVRLEFSTDTVAFDTVFTDLGTPTARLKVYNRNKKAVNISRIQFRNPSSAFTLNVDGVSGTVFHDVEIRGRDSIFIFIECFLPETAAAKPALTEDVLEFVTNGNLQEVVVEAYGQNVTRLRNLRVEQDMTLTPERPYVVFDSLTVAPGATLTINPGTQLLFHDKAKLVVEGKLIAVGEPGKFIDMRGDRLDNVLPNVPYDLLAGQWHGVRFASTSTDNRMEYVDMRSTTDGLIVDSPDAANAGNTTLTLSNCWLHNSESTVLKSTLANVEAYGCCFSEAAYAVVLLIRGQHLFTQCTIANYYLFSAISQPLLTLEGVFPDNEDNTGLPLMKAQFNNSIIYGLAGDINTGDLNGTDVVLQNCLLKSHGNNDANFIDCIWDEDPLFLTDRSEYIFDYRVKEDSPAIGAGNPALMAPATPNDMLGIPRAPSGGKPTIGAYAE